MGGSYSKNSNFVWNGCMGQLILLLLGLVFALISNFGFIILGVIGLWILISFFIGKNDQNKNENI